ncbi:MAG: hypothetical protein RL676_1307 [Pseudomonadota bacterium]
MRFSQRLVIFPLVWAGLFSPAAQAAPMGRVNTQDWTLTLVINRGGALEERLSQFPTRRACYDAMHARIQETRRTRGHSAAGICLKMFVGAQAALSDADDLFTATTTADTPTRSVRETSSVISQANDEQIAVQ